MKSDTYSSFLKYSFTCSSIVIICSLMIESWNKRKSLTSRAFFLQVLRAMTSVRPLEKQPAPSSGQNVAVLWARRSLAFSEYVPIRTYWEGREDLSIVIWCQVHQTELLFVFVKNLELEIIACIYAALNERTFLSHRLDQCWAHFLILRIEEI